MPLKDIDDHKIATFIIKNMLNYDRLDLNKIKATFDMNDFEVREALIRLFKDKKVFGKITPQPDGGIYLVFSADELQNKQLDLQDIIDWDLKQFEIVGTSDDDTLREENLKSLMSSITSKASQVQIMTASKRKEIDQKNLISVEMNVKIIGIKTVLVIGISNASGFHITEGKMRLRFDDFLQIRPQFDDHEFERNEGELMIFINELPAQSSQTLRIYIYDMENRKFDIDGFFQYRNNTFTMRFIKMEQINVDFNLPPIVPSKCDIGEIKTMMKDPDYFKRMQGIGSPIICDFNEIMRLFDEILQKYQLVQILKHNDPTPMWFYSGKIQDPNEEMLDLLAIPQVKNEFFALYVSCKNGNIVSTFIHNIILDFQNYLINRKFLPKDFRVIDLNCTSCQTVLDRFPKSEEEIVCQKCGYNQVIW
ncbi:MAG: hypothetical protein E4G98_00495 [Promethearchaeota archaeon]|nr:MAG: hypothetical protein E4G98_00495 [Candidatus Lokiarchaeota archaeon]